MKPRESARSGMFAATLVLLVAGSAATAHGQTSTGPGQGARTAAPHAGGPVRQAPLVRPGMSHRGGARAPRPTQGIGYTSGSGQQTTNPALPGFGGNPGPPHSTIELPRNPHATFEVPAYSGVQPYPVQGNPAPPQQFGYGFGYALPYAGGYYPGAPDAGYAEGYDTQAQGAQGGGDMTGAPQPAPDQRTPDQRNGAAQPYPGANPSPYPGYNAGTSRRPPYHGAAAGESLASNNRDYTDGLDHPEITLIFKDGRPPERVTNYAMTGTTLWALDGNKQRQIPLASLDLPRTVEKNREAGVEFTPPAQTR